MRMPAQMWLCTQPTDMRRSYDGLAAMVRHQMGRSPLSGHGFVFINRRGTHLKCLYFDTGGYCIWGKRLEQGRFGRVARPDERVRTLSPAEFEALIEGLDWVVKKRRKRWHYSPQEVSDRV